MKSLITLVLFISVSQFTGCRKQVPLFDMSTVDNAFIDRCAKACGVLIVLDERLHQYWGGGYEPREWLFLRAPNNRMVVHKRIMKILSTNGAQLASTFSVIHYRENTPPVEVNVWMKDGTERKTIVTAQSTVPLADWPCQLSYPRKTTFKISTLGQDDTVEIITPILGPEQLFWSFGSHKFCTLKSRTNFGHPDDNNRPDIKATIMDASGGVVRTSSGDDYPMVFELQKPLMPISRPRLPFASLNFRCPDWPNLKAKIFQTPLWMARAEEIADRKKVNPFLVSPIKNNERLRRIKTIISWLNRHMQIEVSDVPLWMQWLPLEPAHQVAINRRGSRGAIAALAYRIFEDTGLKPRFALVHTHLRNPFEQDIPSTKQFQSLAVLVDDENQNTHWYLPGLNDNPEELFPQELAGRQALVMERWWADRQQGTGSCEAEMELHLSCNISTPEPIEVKLITIGDADR
jgi:hypothetical protein